MSSINYKNGSFEFPTGGSSWKTIKGKIVWKEVEASTPEEEQQLIAENKTKIHTKIYAKTGTGGTTGKGWSGFVKVGSNSKHSFSSLSSSVTIGDSYVLLKEYDDWVTHDNGGGKTVNISGKVTGPSGTSIAGVSSSGDKDVSLSTIPRASDFNDFSISIQDNSNVIVTVNRTKKNESFTDILTIGDFSITLLDNIDTYRLEPGNKEKFYKMLGNDMSKDFIGTLTTFNNGSSVGTPSQRIATATLPQYSISLGNISVSDDNANQYIRTGGTLKVSDITGTASSTKKFLQGFSKPKFSSSVDTTTHYNYGNKIQLMGISNLMVDLLGSAVNINSSLNTDFQGGTYRLSAKDGRQNATEKTIDITRIDYSFPEVLLKLTRPNPLGSTINYEINYSYKNISSQAVNYNNPTLKLRYTPSGGSTSEITLTMSGSSGTITGTISNVDYKKSVNAQVELIDMIDYKTISSCTIPSGQPAFNTKKDVNGNNLMYINGALYLMGTDSNNNIVYIPIEVEVVDTW